MSEVSRIRFEILCDFLSKTQEGWKFEKQYNNHFNLNPMLLEEDFGDKSFLEHWNTMGKDFLKKIKREVLGD